MLVCEKGEDLNIEFKIVAAWLRDAVIDVSIFEYTCFKKETRGYDLISEGGKNNSSLDLLSVHSTWLSR